MNIRRPLPEDPYRKRMATAALLVVAGFVLFALLGPDPNPEGEWYEHTGIEGPELLLQDIDIISDVDPIEQELQRSMPEATRGVAPPITEDVVVDRPENPLPKTEEQGEEGLRTTLTKVTDSADRFLDRAERVEMNRASQQSTDFVLLHSVSPRYPAAAGAALRAREIVVRVNMYVDESGRVTQAYVDQNNGGPAFEAAVLEAVRQWVYKPVVIDGEPTGFWDLIYFVFNTPTSRARAAETTDPGSGG